MVKQKGTIEEFILQSTPCQRSKFFTYITIVLAEKNPDELDWRKRRYVGRISAREVLRICISIIGI